MESYILSTSLRRERGKRFAERNRIFDERISQTRVSREKQRGGRRTSIIAVILLNERYTRLEIEVSQARRREGRRGVELLLFYRKRKRRKKKKYQISSPTIFPSIPSSSSRFRPRLRGRHRDLPTSSTSQIPKPFVEADRPPPPPLPGAAAPPPPPPPRNPLGTSKRGGHPPGRRHSALIVAEGEAISRANVGLSSPGRRPGSLLGV